MNATQLELQNVVIDISNKYGLIIDDDTNFNWHDDNEYPQELYYYVKFNDEAIDKIIDAANIPVFLTISEEYIRFDVDSAIVVGHKKHSKFSKKTINFVKKYIAENFCDFS